MFGAIFECMIYWNARTPQISPVKPPFLCSPAALVCSAPVRESGGTRPTECLMLHFFTNSLDPAARRSARRLLNRKKASRVELSSWGGREREDDQRQTSVTRSSRPVVGRCRDCTTPVFTLILPLCSRQIRREGEALQSRLAFYSA